jgi:hypothetical protein
MRTKGEHFLSNEIKLWTNPESSVSTLIVEVLIFQASSVAITKLGSLHPGENGKREASEHGDEATPLSSVSISVALAPMSFLSLPPACLLLTRSARGTNSSRYGSRALHVFVHQPVPFVSTVTATEPTWDICFRNPSRKIRHVRAPQCTRVYIHDTRHDLPSTVSWQK